MGSVWLGGYDWRRGLQSLVGLFRGVIGQGYCWRCFSVFEEAARGIYLGMGFCSVCPIFFW